jgi:hypothetical protein
MGNADPYAAEMREALVTHVDQFALLIAGEAEDIVKDVLETVNAQLSQTLPDPIVELVLRAILGRRDRIERTSDFENQRRLN